MGRPLDKTNRKRRKKRKARRLENPQISKRGKPQAITDEDLILRRNSLVMLFEFKWGEVAWKLQHVKKLEDLLSCLGPLCSDGNVATLEPVIQCLLREEAQNVTGSELRGTREAYLNLQRQQSIAQALIQTLEKEVIESMVALRQARSKPELSKSAKSERKERVSLLRQVRQIIQIRVRARDEQIAVWRSFEKERQVMLKELQRQETHYSRTELFRFLRSKKYELNPLNLANAIAGMPFIGWRQSFRRSKPQLIFCGPSFRFLAFRFLQKCLAQSRPTSREEAERFLREEIMKLIPKKKTKKTSEIRRLAIYLKENWVPLEKALRDSWSSASQPPELPYVISAAFVRNQFLTPSALENILAASQSTEV